jgi:hypothetical protein
MDEARSSRQTARKRSLFAAQTSSDADIAAVISGWSGREAAFPAAVKQPNIHEPPRLRRLKVRCRSRSQPGLGPDPRQRLP